MTYFHHKLNRYLAIIFIYRLNHSYEYEFFYPICTHIPALTLCQCLFAFVGMECKMGMEKAISSHSEMSKGIPLFWQLHVQKVGKDHKQPTSDH